MKCDRCDLAAFFVVTSPGMSFRIGACRDHLADRVSYLLGLVPNVVVRRLPAAVTAAVTAAEAVRALGYAIAA